jgi:hypothetical protein
MEHDVQSPRLEFKNRSGSNHHVLGWAHSRLPVLQGRLVDHRVTCEGRFNADHGNGRSAHVPQCQVRRSYIRARSRTNPGVLGYQRHLLCHCRGGQKRDPYQSLG